MMRERRAYIVLVGICIVLCVITLLISASNARNQTKKACMVLVIEAQYPPAKPGIGATKEVIKKWRVYQGRLALMRSLGC